MSSYYTSDKLIQSIKRRAMIPQNQNTFLSDDFLAFADEEMSMGLVPSVLRMHEDYYLRTDKVPLVSGKSRYAIPYRAIGNKLREIAFQDVGGNIQEMTRIPIEDRSNYTANRAYYIENNDIVLMDNSAQQNGYLLISYYLRPNSLVLLEKIAVISDINRVTGVIQVSNFPSSFTTATLLDLIKVKSPHKIAGYDIKPISVDNLTKIITLSITDIPDDLEVGDHVSIATESAIPQLPSDLHVVLAHRVAARCMEALGDTEGLQAANQKLAELEQQTTVIIDNRVEGSPKKVVNKRSTLRGGLSSRRGRF